MNTRDHSDYLDYRDRHVYFGQNKPPMTFEAFAPLELEWRELESLGDARSAEQELRYVELSQALHHD